MKLFRHWFCHQLERYLIWLQRKDFKKKVTVVYVAFESLQAQDEGYPWSKLMKEDK